MKFQVREAILADMPDVAAMFYSLSEEESGEKLSEESERVNLSRIMNEYFRGDTFTYVVEVKGRRGKMHKIGFVSFDVRTDELASPIVWGHHLYLEPKYRGTGAADLLLSAGETHAKLFKAKRIFVETPIPQYFFSKGYKIDRTIVVKELKN